MDFNLKIKLKERDRIKIKFYMKQKYSRVRYWIQWTDKITWHVVTYVEDWRSN